MTALRALVAGEVREGVDAFRATLRRLFAWFERLGGFVAEGGFHDGVDGAPGLSVGGHDDLVVDHPGATFVLYPRVRADAIVGAWDDATEFRLCGGLPCPSASLTPTA